MSTPAANQGSLNAQLELGFMYREGAGIPQDNEQAASWFLLAANQGSVAAQHQLGVMYTKGAGVPQDYRQSFIWSSVAADNGDEDAPLYRDFAAARLTPAALAEARAQAAALRGTIAESEPESED